MVTMMVIKYSVTRLRNAKLSKAKFVRCKTLVNLSNIQK